MRNLFAAAALAAFAIASPPASAQRADVRHVAFAEAVTEVRQVGDTVFARAGGWFRLSLCDAAPICADPAEPPPRNTAPDGIPHGFVATAPSGGVTGAWYTQPTARYDHGVLGDAIEGGGLAVQSAAGRLDVTLSDRFVFEDIAPRLADLDQDGINEIVTIRSDIFAGAAIAVYETGPDGLVEVAATKPIGQQHRWLNIAGIADYSGDGRLDIAMVRTPHIRGRLEVWTLRGNRLERLGTVNGFSNHAIGSTELGLAATADFNGDSILDLAVPDSSRLSLRYVSLAGGTARILDATPLAGRVTTALGLLAGPQGPVIVVGLDRGRMAVITP